MDELEPIEKIVRLPKAKIDLKITTFDPKQVILSLLSDKSLWNYDNLNAINPDDEMLAAPRFGPDNMPEDHVYSDLMSGKLARLLYEQKVEAHGRELVIPLVFFIDKTHTDRHGRLSLEPVCVTLGCFNRETRAKPSAWRTLGFIPNSGMFTTAKYPSDKLRDYHYVLSSILEGISGLMKEGPILWEFPPSFFKDETPTERMALIRLGLGPVLGDTEGLDKICGKYNSRTDVIPYLCRKCDIPYAKTGNPFHPRKRWQRHKICDCTVQYEGEGKKRKKRIA